MPDQPVRHEVRRQRRQYSAKCREIYQGVSFWDVTDVPNDEMINTVSKEKTKVKSCKYR